MKAPIPTGIRWLEDRLASLDHRIFELERLARQQPTLRFRDLTDTSVAQPDDGQVPVYRTASGLWVAETP